MPGFDTETRTLGEERDRLDRELDAIVQELADADPSTPGGQMLQSEARDLDQAGQAVAALIEEYGADAEVTVQGLSAGKYARVEDRVDSMQAEKSGPGGVPGSSANVYAAEGLVDAPFLPDFGEDEAHDLDTKIAAVSSESLGVRKWLQDLVDDLTEADEGNWQPLGERLAETDLES